MNENNLILHTMITHDICELPVELCVCGDILFENDLECGLCGFDFIGAVPPGFPIEDLTCPECLIKGFIRRERLLT